MYCIVLYILYCIILYCIVLYYIVLYYIVLYCIILFILYIILYYVILYYIILYIYVHTICILYIYVYIYKYTATISRLVLLLYLHTFPLESQAATPSSHLMVRSWTEEVCVEEIGPWSSASFEKNSKVWGQNWVLGVAFISNLSPSMIISYHFDFFYFQKWLLNGTRLINQAVGKGHLWLSMVWGVEDHEDGYHNEEARSFFL